MFAKSAQRLGYIVITQNTHVQSVKRIIVKFWQNLWRTKNHFRLPILLKFDVYVLGSWFVIIVGTENRNKLSVATILNFVSGTHLVRESTRVVKKGVIYHASDECFVTKGNSHLSIYQHLTTGLCFGFLRPNFVFTSLRVYSERVF